MKFRYYFVSAICVILIAALAGCSSAPVPETPVRGEDGVIRSKNTVGYGEGASSLRFGELADCSDEKSLSGPSEYSAHTERKPGMMTGAEQYDVKDISKWRSMFVKDQNGDNWETFVKNRGLDGRLATVVSVECDGEPVYNIRVTLCRSDGTAIYEARTDMSGVAVLCCPEKEYSGSLDVKIGDSIALSDVDLKTSAALSASIGEKTEEVGKLDLMLMIDTTGSMGDELWYLQEELSDMVKRIAGEDNALSVRTSVNFYRDEGDEYVVKYYDFRDDAEEAVRIIKEQNADGGGDYPEAVHTALDNAINGHVWRDDAVKLCYFVLDAPPHEESEIQGINGEIYKSIESAAKQGVRIIPVAASGINEETEFILRSFAVMTGGTYIFITDDSGIGLPHETPKVDDYTVEPLNECMIRVACRYCGVRYNAQQKQ
ncbi:MAG: VWA domain-containing protein [Clostridia bacterium]|nr:VWA domain-containing protein [Clostridia bacterium]